MNKNEAKPAGLPADGTVKVTFQAPHSHAGKNYVAGDSIHVTRAVADRIAVFAQVTVEG